MFLLFWLGTFGHRGRPLRRKTRSLAGSLLTGHDYPKAWRRSSWRLLLFFKFLLTIVDKWAAGVAGKSLQIDGGQGRNRTADASLFRAALYQLSYLASLGLLCTRETSVGFNLKAFSVRNGSIIQQHSRQRRCCRPAGARRDTTPPSAAVLPRIPPASCSP